MPRKTRFTLPYHCHHVMLRGNRGVNVFHCDADRVRFCLMLQKASEEHQFFVHAFCFMSNHIHLILEPTEVHLSRCIHAFASRYAQYFNRRYSLRGHLFQDRFRSILVEKGTDYLKRLVRYIHLNPVSAKLCKSPKEYIWSSYLTYLGVNPITWVTTDKVLMHFSYHDLTEGLKNMVRFTNDFAEAEVELDWVEDFDQLGVMGGEEFIKSQVKLSQTEKQELIEMPNQIDLNLILKEVCKELDVSISDIQSPTKERRVVNVRSVIALIVKKSPTHTFAELASILGKDASALSKLALRASKNDTLDTLSTIMLNKLIR